MTMQRAAIPLIVVVVLAGAFFLRAEDSSEEQDLGHTLRRVRTAEVLAGLEQQDLRFSGVTRSARRAHLAFTLRGRLESRPVEVGDRVRAGQVVASLGARKQHNAVASAEAALAELDARLAQSRRDLERSERLHGLAAATEEELERSRATVDTLSAAQQSAAASLAEARRNLRESSLRAPFAGVVTEVHLEPGEFAESGLQVLSLAGDGEVEVEVEVPESVAASLQLGTEIKAQLPALQRQLTGRVRSLGQGVLGPGRLFPVVVGFEPIADLRSGLTVEVALVLEGEPVLSVPVEAVVDPSGRAPAVFRVQGERVQRVAVQVGSLSGDRVSVRSEQLSAGDRVVVAGQGPLLDGDEVEVLP